LVKKIDEAILFTGITAREQFTLFENEKQ